MTVTTIKVTTATRDRLKRQARMAGSSLGDHLAHLADLADRDDRFDRLHRAVTSTSPALADGLADETGQWEAAELSDAD